MTSHIPFPSSQPLRCDLCSPLLFLKVQSQRHQEIQPKTSWALGRAELDTTQVTFFSCMDLWSNVSDCLHNILNWEGHRAPCTPRPFASSQNCEVGSIEAILQ